MTGRFGLTSTNGGRSWQDCAKILYFGEFGRICPEVQVSSNLRRCGRHLARDVPKAAEFGPTSFEVCRNWSGMVDHGSKSARARPMFVEFGPCLAISDDISSECGLSSIKLDRSLSNFVDTRSWFDGVPMGSSSNEVGVICRICIIAGQTRQNLARPRPALAEVGMTDAGLVQPALVELG